MYVCGMCVVCVVCVCVCVCVCEECSGLYVCVCVFVCVLGRKGIRAPSLVIAKRE